MKKKKPLSTQAFELLQEKFVNLELKPGDFVTEQELCALISIGRMPIKEALNRLMQLQLVQIIPRKGIRIPSIEWNDIFQQIEIYRYLRAIQYKLGC